MDKKILNEINRNLELMGITSINEQENDSRLFRSRKNRNNDNNDDNNESNSFVTVDGQQIVKSDLVPDENGYGTLELDGKKYPFYKGTFKTDERQPEEGVAPYALTKEVQKIKRELEKNLYLNKDFSDKKVNLSRQEYVTSLSQNYTKGRRKKSEKKYGDYNILVILRYDVDIKTGNTDQSTNDMAINNTNVSNSTDAGQSVNQSNTTDAGQSVNKSSATDAGKSVNQSNATDAVDQSSGSSTEGIPDNWKNGILNKGWVLMRGSHAQEEKYPGAKKAIEFVQAKVGLSGNDVDGLFGPKTEQAVINYQKQNELEPDGKVGDKTLSKMLNVK